MREFVTEAGDSHGMKRMAMFCNTSFPGHKAGPINNYPPYAVLQ